MTICEICGGTGWVPCAGGPHGLSHLKRWCNHCHGVGSFSGGIWGQERYALKRAEATERAQREGWVGLPAMEEVCVTADGEGRR